jgi:hypothetical protein
MGRSSSSAALRRLQRRFSFMLSAALCLWMLALATHFHTGDYDDKSHQGTHELCAFCASVPSTGAAPAVVAFVSAPQLRPVSSPVAPAPSVPSPTLSRYYSRGPPLV